MSGTAQVFVPAVGGLFWEKSHASGAIGGILTGIFVLIFATLFLKMNASYAGVLGSLSNTLVFFILSKICIKDDNVCEKITASKQLYEKKYS